MLHALNCNGSRANTLSVIVQLHLGLTPCLQVRLYAGCVEVPQSQPTGAPPLQRADRDIVCERGVVCQENHMPTATTGNELRPPLRGVLPQ